MPFRYQAIDPQGKTVTDVIDATSAREAADLLRDRRLFVTQLTETSEAATTVAPGTTEGKADGKLKEVVFFTQQLSMLIRSGARVTQALTVMENQCQRPAWRRVVSSVRSEVEAGRPLSTALARFPKLFTPVYVNMISAGEASGNMGLAFDRLTKLMRQQQEIRNRVIGALSYPAGLTLLCVAVIGVLFTFVLPRFEEMFETVGVDLPASTRVLLTISKWCIGHWPWLIAGALGAVVGLVVFVRSAAGQQLLSRTMVRVPIFGRIVRSVILAQVCRVWGQLLESKVGLLEAVELTQDSTTNFDFRVLLAKTAEAITGGQSVGGPLLSSWLVPQTFSAAIATGEESGRLGDALLFVAGCLDEDNGQVLASLGRIIEPLLLSIMGLIVGTVAISLFMPLFDLATIAGAH